MKENKYLELKEKISDTFIKTVSAFANFNTGKIIFGVNDAGKIVGIENLDKACLDIENKINDLVKPKPDFSFEIDRNKNIITLTIEEGAYKPYLYKGKAYKRNSTSTVEVDQVELKRLVLLGDNIYFEEIPIKNKDLKFDYLFNELNKKLLIKSNTSDILKSLGLLDRNNMYNNAAALLSDINKFSGIDIIKFGSNINEIIYRETILNTSILNQFNKTEEIFNMYYRIEEIKGMKRNEKYLIPIEAFREAIANALVHRIWDVNTNIRIAMFEDRIEIYSPGGLPFGLTEDEYLNGYISNLRNPIIANVFFRLEIIEKFGTGIMRIKKAYENIANKPVFDIKENSILVILPTENKRNDLTKDEKLVFDFLNENILSNSDIVSLTGFGKDKVLNIINGLINKRYVEKIGNGRGTRYKLI